MTLPNGASPQQMAPRGADFPSAFPMSSGRYAEEEGNRFDFAQIVSILRRRWKAMLAVFVVVLSWSLYRAGKVEPIYESQAMIEVSIPDRTSTLEGIPGLEEYVKEKKSGGDMATQVTLIQGGQLRDQALKRLSPEMQEKVKVGLRHFEASAINDTNLIAVKVQALDPESAAQYANAVCQEYIATTLTNNQRRSMGAIRYVEDQMQKVRSRLTQAQGELTDYKKQTGIFSVSAQAEALGSRVGAVRSLLEEAQAERAATAARLATAQSILATIPKGNVVPAAKIRNTELTGLRTRLGELEVERTALLEEFQPTSVRVKNVDNQISAIKKRLASQPDTVIEEYREDPRRQPLEQEIATSTATLKSLDARIRSFQGQLGNAEGAYKNLPDQEYQFIALSSEAESLLKNYNLLYEKLQSLRISANARVSDGVLQSKAVPALAPISADPNRRIFSAIAFALVAAIGIALLWDLLDNRIYSDDDAQRATGLPVLAQIPLEKRPERQLISNTGTKMTPVLESFRMLRANIAFSAADRPIRSLVVTSSLPNEGKSTTAINLATAAALCGESVILLDLDLRRPTQHVLSGLSNTPGFVNIVSGNCSIEEATQESSVEGLKIITAGSIPPNPYKILNSDAARQTIQKLTQMADLVIIDTPPLLGLADARLVASFVDGSIMVVSCEETKRRDASRASDLLHSTNSDIVGTVFTKVPHASAGYSDYYTYRSYSRSLEQGKGAEAST